MITSRLRAACGRHVSNAAWTLMALCVACLLTAAAQPAAAQSDTMERAQMAYASAQYDEAIALFAEVARDTSAGIPARKEALQYLGRAYIARDQLAQAREAIHDLLDLEPPLVELNPDMEPPDLMQLYYEVRRDYQGDFEVERDSSVLQTLAIMDFTNTSVDEKQRFDPMQQGFASMMINLLSGQTDLKVVERERIQWLLDELELQRDPSLIDQSTAVRTGRLLGASSVLFGAFTVHRNQMWLSARLVKVETGEILFAEQIRGERDNFFELAEQLGAQVASSIDLTVDAIEIGQRTETRSLEAALAYSEGLALLERRDYDGAYEKFMEALEHDPEYSRAEMRAESIRPLLS